MTDTNGRRDVYVYDRTLATYAIVSRASDGITEGNGESSNCDGSDDLSIVAFASTSSNLTAGDTNGAASDVFVYDRGTSALRLVSGGLTGTQFADSVSVDGTGRYLAFRANGTLVASANGRIHAVVFDRTGGTYELASVATDGTQANGDVSAVSISDSGTVVAFVSSATNLVAGDTNAQPDAFVHDRATGVTTRVSVATGGVEATGGGANGVVVSGDGRWVAFASSATNLVAGDGNGQADVFVHDRTTGRTVRVSVTTAGVEATGGSFPGDLSRDGRYVSFTSGATNLATADGNASNDVFLYDLSTSTLRTISATTAGVIGNAASDNARLSSDGRWVVFNGRASNLVTGAGGGNDVFLRDLSGP